MKQLLLELFQMKKRGLAVVGGLLLLNLVFYILVNVYQANTLKTAKSTWSNLRTRVAAIESGDVNAQYRQGKADLETLYKHIPLKRQFPRVLGDILEQAESNNLLIGPITYRPQSIKEEKLLAYGVSMSVAGKYAAVKSFLGDLQKHTELVVVENVSMTNSDPYEENVVMDLTLTIYLQESA